MSVKISWLSSANKRLIWAENAKECKDSLCKCTDVQDANDCNSRAEKLELEDKQNGDVQTENPDAGVDSDSDDDASDNEDNAL